MGVELGWVLTGFKWRVGGRVRRHWAGEARGERGQGHMTHAGDTGAIRRRNVSALQCLFQAGAVGAHRGRVGRDRGKRQCWHKHTYL